MFKRYKIKSRKKMSRNHLSNISIKSSNLSLSTSNVNNTPCSTRKSKCMSTISTNINYKSSMIEQPQSVTRVPENVAIHFGNFYGLWNDEKAYCSNNWNNQFIKEETAMDKRPQRLEFTRQMVHKLERATDMEDYIRQVSAFLKKTVEPPNFKLNQLLSKNSIPNGIRSSSDYPLWYKEPHKISLVFSNPIAQLET